MATVPAANRPPPTIDLRPVCYQDYAADHYLPTKHVKALSENETYAIYVPDASLAFSATARPLRVDVTVFSATAGGDVATIDLDPACMTQVPTSPGESFAPSAMPTAAPFAAYNRGEIRCGDTMAADTGDPNLHVLGGLTPEHVYTFTAVGDVEFTFSTWTCGSPVKWDTYLRIFDSTGAQVAYNDDDTRSECLLQSTVTYLGTPGEVYSVVVEGFVSVGGVLSNKGPYTLTMSTGSGSICPDYCPEGYGDYGVRYNWGLGQITIVATHQQCADRCSLYSAPQFNGGCKAFMTGMYYGMLFCRSYGGNFRTQPCASWAAPGDPGVASGAIGSVSDRTNQENVGGNCCSNSTFVGS